MTGDACLAIERATFVKVSEARMATPTSVVAALRRFRMGRIERPPR